MTAVSKTKAFTLIELLVVIAIIAILAAILFPVFAQARAAARKTVCVSNMKQITLGCLMYVQDYDETYAQERSQGYYNNGNDGEPVPNQFGTWRILVQPYIKNTAIFHCPEDSMNVGWSEGYQDAVQFDHCNTSNCWANSPNTSTHATYAYNGFIFDHCTGPSGGIVSQAAIQGPANVIFLAEHRQEWPDIGLWTIMPWHDGSYSPPYPAGYGPLSSHHGQLNWAFFDGHVKTMKLAATIAPQPWLWSEPADPTNPDACGSTTPAALLNQINTVFTEYK